MGLGMSVKGRILGPVFALWALGPLVAWHPRREWHQGDQKGIKKESSCSPGQELSNWLSEIPLRKFGDPQP